MSYVGLRAVVIFPRDNPREQGGKIMTEKPVTIRLDGSGRIVAARECFYAVVGRTIDESRDPGRRK